MGATAVIRAIEFHLPQTVVSNDDLARDFPGWPVEKIGQKTGIRERHIAAPGECSSDLAVAAARRLFDSGACTPTDVDFILLCTQSPDYFLPTTACLVQERLGVPTTAGALDFNLGHSGYVYGLALATGLVERGMAQTVLLITAETYSKFIHRGDKSVRTIFGDAATATLVSGVEGPDTPSLGPFVFGTDGKGAANLIVPTGGMRCGRTPESAVATEDESGNIRSRDNLYMNGAEVFAFTLRTVPAAVNALLEKAEINQEDVDLFIFHQANRHILETLRKQLKIAQERFFIYLENCGNTVSNTLPIALKAATQQNRIRKGDRVMLVGFGVGYSWSGALVRWTGDFQNETATS